MSADRTEDVIVALAADAGPVTALAPAQVRLGRWLGASAVLTAAGAALIGIRDDLPRVLHDDDFVGDAALTLMTGGLAASAAFALSVPGAERTRWQRLLPAAAAAGWVALLARRLPAVDGFWTALTPMPWHPACAGLILLLSAIPAVAAFVMLRRAAPLHPRWAGAMASLAAAAFAALGLQFACPFDSASHLLASHAAPVMALTGIGALAGVGALAAGRR